MTNLLSTFTGTLFQRYLWLDTYTFLSQISFLTLNRFIVSITLFEQWNTFEFITKNPVPGCMPVFSRNLSQSFFHHTLKSRHKKLWYCTDWRMEMPPKLMPDQVPFDSMFRPHRLLSYDSNCCWFLNNMLSYQVGDIGILSWIATCCPSSNLFSFTSLPAGTVYTSWI